MELEALFKFPIVQGPMAGGSCTPELIAAVSNAGGLGAMPCALLSPETMREQAAKVRQLTDRPFLMNFFVLETPSPSEEELKKEFEYKNLKGLSYRSTIWQIVQHVFNHGTYHRGQLINMLRQLGVEKVPQTDFIIWSRKKN